MKVVCGTCNNGWMSDIENAAKPIMTLMISGRPCDLDVFAQRQVANWATLKMMVAEQNEAGNVVTSLQHRDHFKERRAIPDQTNIYIAKCGEGGWESAYWRITETVSDSLENRPSGPNTHSVTLGIGKLLIHISHSSMPKLDLSLVVNDPTLVMQNWPIRAPVLHWPPRQLCVRKKLAYWLIPCPTWQSRRTSDECRKRGNRAKPVGRQEPRRPRWTSQ